MARFVQLLSSRIAAACAGFAVIGSAAGAENVTLLDVPDYAWYAGCFGTASGNLIGYWDRHGLPDMYTGPTGGGLAPLNSSFLQGNDGIRALWASQQGVDGRPTGQPGHIEDYWASQNGTGSFEDPGPDPYVTLGRPEHPPDSLGDFIGQSQRKYTDLNGECSGNIDGFAFNFWDKTGNRRTNFVPTVNGTQVPDIQSGLRDWSRYRGYSANVSSQLADVNPEQTKPLGTGFSFEDIKAEINAGYPVLLILQNHNEFSRQVLGVPGLNPHCHAILVHGYVVTDGGLQAIHFRTSWGDGGDTAIWSSDIIIAQLPIRGAITYHPEPKITNIERNGNQVRLQWHGPNSVLYDEMSGSSTPVHQYVVERATTLSPANFSAITEAVSELDASFTAPEEGDAFFRVRLLTP